MCCLCVSVLQSGHLWAPWSGAASSSSYFWGSAGASVVLTHAAATSPAAAVPTPAAVHDTVSKECFSLFLLPSLHRSLFKEIYCHLVLLLLSLWGGEDGKEGPTCPGSCVSLLRPGCSHCGSCRSFIPYGPKDHLPPLSGVQHGWRWELIKRFLMDVLIFNSLSD